MSRDYTRQEVLEIVERTAARHGIPKDDFLRASYIETGGRFDERAHNSRTGAAGLYQFMPETAPLYGLRGDDVYDPVKNADAAARLYLDNQRTITRSHDRTGRPYLSGEAQPNGLDMYLAHQQGAGGYTSIQAAIATGSFLDMKPPTRVAILSNVDGDDLRAITGVSKEQLRGMSDRDMAQTFVRYWDTKYERIAIPEVGIAPLAPGQSAPRAPVDPMADGVLRHGERGEAVKQLQESLNRAGIRDANGQPLPTTGYFGDQTEAAVRQYQTRHGLEVDGKAGENTLRSLGLIDDAQRNRSQPAQPSPTPSGQQPAQPQQSQDPNLKANFQASEFLKQQSPQVRAYLDLVAWKEVHQSLNPDGSPAGYRERNGVNGSRGLMPESAIADNGTLPRDELRYNVGRYQMKQVDVDDMRARYDRNIDDFSPESQDRIAVAKMKYRGVIEPLMSGDIRTAIQRGGQEWASLPGSPYGQVQAGYTADQAVAYYNQRLAFHQALDRGQTSSTRTESTPAVDPMSDGVLRHGERGEAVRRLQESLNRAGIRDANGQPLPTTGYFGDQTEAAVRQYQTRQGLEVDGKAGRDTLAALQANAPARTTGERTEPVPSRSDQGGHWPAPGNHRINEADKPGEGRGEHNTPRSNRSGRHTGLDIQGNLGDRIEPFAPGRVVFADVARGYGNTVVIDHGNGQRTLYAHLQRIDVKVGDDVTTATRIGTMGRSGNTPSTGDTHLHFEVRLGARPGEPFSGRDVDPMPYLRGQQRLDGSPVRPVDPMADGVLKHGERGEAVRQLQEALNRAGIRDANGQPLPTTGYFGDMTEAAVRQYQTRQGLEVDGKAGRDTLGALGLQPGQVAPKQETPRQEAPRQEVPRQETPRQETPRQETPGAATKPMLDDPRHPDHRMYRQAVSNLEQLGPSGGFRSRDELERAAAAITADARASGLGEITHISRAQAPNGQTYLIAVQGDPTNPASKNAYLDHAQAVTQTVEQSTRMAEANKPAQDPVSQQIEQNRVAMGGR